jgi:predicted RNase H-like HicB family nuclease
MRILKYTYWQDDDFYIGFINDYPDYPTQGITKEELIDNLKSLLSDIESNEIPYIRKIEELLVA